jgi:hypothetical protein
MRNTHGHSLPRGCECPLQFPHLHPRKRTHPTPPPPPSCRTSVAQPGAAQAQRLELEHVGLPDRWTRRREVLNGRVAQHGARSCQQATLLNPEVHRWPPVAIPAPLQCRKPSLNPHAALVPTPHPTTIRRTPTPPAHLLLIAKLRVAVGGRVGTGQHHQALHQLRGRQRGLCVWMCM